MQASYWVPKPEQISSAAGLWLLHSEGAICHAQAHHEHNFFRSVHFPPPCFYFSISSTSSLSDPIFALHCLLFSFLSSQMRQSSSFSDTQEHRSFWRAAELRHLRTRKTWGVNASPTAPKAEMMPYKNWLKHSSGEKSMALEMPKLTEDATLLFLYKKSRLKGSYLSMSDSKIPYSQYQREFRASTNKFPSKAIPRRHLQKNLSTPYACQRLLKQLSQDHSLTGHFITASPLFLRPSRVWNSNTVIRTHVTKYPVFSIQGGETWRPPLPPRDHAVFKQR